MRFIKSSSALLVVSTILWVIRFLADVDFIVARTKDPGWMKEVAMFFLDAPDWFIGALFISGLLLLWYTCRVNQNPSQVSLGNIQQTKKIDRKDFISEPKAFGRGTQMLMPHELGGPPQSIQVTLICRKAEYGYKAGDKHVINFNSIGLVIVPDSTYLKIQFPDRLSMKHKTNQTYHDFDLANWNLVFQASL